MALCGTVFALKKAPFKTLALALNLVNAFEEAMRQHSELSQSIIDFQSTVSSAVTFGEA